MVTKVGNNLNISWNPPFSLKNISNYSVYVRSDESEQMFNTSKTHLILPESRLMENHNYAFQVSAHNLVGEGNRSDPVKYDG